MSRAFASPCPLRMRLTRQITSSFEMTPKAELVVQGPGVCFCSVFMSLVRKMRVVRMRAPR